MKTYLFFDTETTGLPKNYNAPLTDTEKELFSKTAALYATKPTRYDFINFIDQVIYVTTGKWPGKTGEDAKKRVYCSEFDAICMDAVRGCFNGQTASVNPLDIQLSECLVELNAG